MPLDFPSPKELRKHTKRHWQEFNLSDEFACAEYLALARAFCTGTCPIGTDECIRTCDTKVGRFCDMNGQFAVMMPDRTIILTFHVLHPRVAVGVPIERTHRFDTNREYFDADCVCLS